MAFEFIKNFGELALISMALYFTLATYVYRMRPEYSPYLKRRRYGVLLLLVLAVVAIKVGEDVVNKESGPVDEVVLRFIHTNVPTSLNGLFEVATLTGSSYVLFPLSVVVVAALLLAKRRFEALLVAISVISGAVIVYTLKSLVNRDRPALWATEWYWGSSFPSGHTLVVAAFATAVVIGVVRIWRGAHLVAMSVAGVWIFSVAISRLVLGVHWPSDVLAAACIGAFIPLTVGIGLELRHV